MHYKWTLHSRTSKQVKHLWFAKLRVFFANFLQPKKIVKLVKFLKWKNVKFEFFIYGVVDLCSSTIDGYRGSRVTVGSPTVHPQCCRSSGSGKLFVSYIMTQNNTMTKIHVVATELQQLLKHNTHNRPSLICHYLEKQPHKSRCRTLCSSKVNRTEEKLNCWKS